MLVKHPLEKKTWESAATASGTMLNMTSHSEAPSRGKCMPARALRYCPVMLQVHSLWMPFNLFTLYMRRAPLRPREGYRPGETAVQRMKRQPSREVTMTVTQLTTNESRARCQTISNSGVTLKYSSESSASPAGSKARASQKSAAVGTTMSQKDRKICIRRLRVSSSQIGYAY